MRKSKGAPSGTGSRASHEAASSTASSPKASIPSAWAELAFANALARQGVQASGSALVTCGPTTGHFVRALAFCESPEIATVLARFIAIATEAQRAETPKSDSVHEGAGPEDIVQ